MQNTAAAVTMVRDDPFFLRIWLDYYGNLFGRENCYIINHGRGEEVASMAAGCNVIGIPGDHHKNFEVKRWRLLNNLTMGLRSYYSHVIVGDVDEFVVVDPASGIDLLKRLSKAPTERVLTPLGLEVIHRLELEPEPIVDKVLGPRRHVRVVPRYSKPCVVSAITRISRGGHFSRYDKLHTPDDLYMLHLKYCDFANYVDTLNARNQMTKETGVGFKQTSIGRHWFAEGRGEDRAVFQAFDTLRLVDGFDMSPYRNEMHRTFQPRGDTGFWEFSNPTYKEQFELPERFFGIL
ncbi:glycosyltransferase family 2 protein [Paracoccus aerodenitrificans]|uniref:glycosyltransferase family 2 protein n=1 Tax=Paracoccus aerodenitrificans TaxID=3017781 RepID=UPI0022F0D7D5|nr:glycosyltransferase family 2 protein [Paracoccus aerodenitrificans]WBU63540.1 hypothetical protein PAE61_14425 [Paracoccus aerodenitrificans]